jgi:hypothetical protein
MDPYFEDEFKEDGGNDLRSVRWHSLTVCWTGWCYRLAVGSLGEASDISMMRVGACSGKLARFIVTYEHVL